MHLVYIYIYILVIYDFEVISSLVILFDNKQELIYLHTVNWFLELLSNMKSSVCKQLNDFMVCFDCVLWHIKLCGVFDGRFCIYIFVTE